MVTPIRARVDTEGMFDATAGLPEQVAEAAQAVLGLDGLPDHSVVENVVVLGMGGSGIAGDVLAAVAGPFMPVPVVVSKGYELPGFVGEGTLAFAISFSGNTEETVEAASEAAAEGAKVVSVCAGGELARRAEAWEMPWVRVPADIPQPRAAIGALSVPPLVVLEAVGLFPGARQWIDRAVEQLHRRRDQILSDDGGVAAEVANRIGRTIPLVYGGGQLGAAAALRWKCQFNENAKTPAFWNANPELCHNEIAGWGQHGDLTRQALTLVALRHDDEHPQVMRRFELVFEQLDEVVAQIVPVHAEGDGQLAQLLDLVLVGDFASLYLAAREGIDPGPIPALDLIKQALASGAAADA